MAHTITTTHSGFGLLQRIQAYIEDFKAARKEHQDYRKTVNELSALSNRDLADIGLRRCDIEDVAAIHALR